MQELRGFAEAGARRHCGPQSGIVRAEVPGGGAAHAEAADQDAILVHRIVALDGVERFEEIDFAGELVGVAVAAVEVEHDGVARREFAGGLLAGGEKIDFAEGFVAAVEPRVDAPAMRRGGRIGRRHDQAVGLHALVDLRNVAADYQAGGRRPRRLAGGQLGGAFFALLEQHFGLGDFVGLEEFVVLEGVADGFVVDQDVGQERAGLKFID